MSQLPLFNIDGNSAGEVSVSDEIFGRKMNETVVHSVLNWFLASRRRGTHSALTRSEVSGGGIKPWKQKGTGRARAGSIRSPLWRGGGVIFGPKPRDYNYALPKKVRRLAIKIALSDKAREGKIKIVDQLKINECKTKAALKIFKGLGLSGKTLVILGEDDEVFYKAARNLPGVKIGLANELNIFDLLNAEWVVIDKETVPQIEEVFA